MFIIPSPVNEDPVKATSGSKQRHSKSESSLPHISHPYGKCNNKVLNLILLSVAYIDQDTPSLCQLELFNS